MLLNSMQRNKIYALVSVETARFLYTENPTLGVGFRGA